MHIQLGNRNRGVAHPFLQLKWRDALFCFVGAEGMPEGMGAEVFGDAGERAVFFNDFFSAATGKANAIVVEKNMRIYTALSDC